MELPEKEVVQSKFVEAAFTAGFNVGYMLSIKGPLSIPERREKCKLWFQKWLKKKSS